MRKVPGRSGGRQLTVAAIPAGHVYPSTIRPEGVVYPPDPVVDPAEPGRWWPHPLLDAGWWSDPAHAVEVGKVDAVHLHFGFEHLGPDGTQAFVDALGQRGIPLVLTVHDLDNPHLADPAAQTEHHRQLGILSAAARVVFTLTEEAARRIRVDFGVEAQVVPHPRVVTDPEAVTRTAPAPGAPQVAGVFLKSLRANVVTDPDFHLAVADGVAAAGALLRVHLHDDRADSGLGRTLAAADDAGRLELRLHPPLPDGELFRAVADCDAVLLPYLRGTHSGWLEMCRDLGVPVAVPDCGCYLSQADDPAAVSSHRTGDPADATRALLRLLRGGRIPYRGDRTRQLAGIRDTHRRVYEAVAR